MDHINKLVGKVLDIGGAPKLSGSERAKRARLELEAAEREEAADIERHRLAAELGEKLAEAAREKAAREAEEAAEEVRMVGLANDIRLPAQISFTRHNGYEREPQLDIKNITSRYDVFITGKKSVIYRIADTGELVASDVEIPLEVYEVESQLFPDGKVDAAAKLYAAWLLAKVSALAESAHRDVEGASVLYCAKLPRIRIIKNTKYKGLSSVICEWGDFYVSGLGD